MIVKNEERTLARCLDSIKDAVDEIIIVDTGSTDQTKTIALDYTQCVYDFPWINDFAAARNEAFSKATMGYQMWLDADDVFPAESLEKLLALKASLDPAVDIVTMKYITCFDPVFSFSRERMFKREKGYTWQDPVHEFIQMSGNILRTDIEVHHKKEAPKVASTRNLDIYTSLVKTGKTLTPRQLYYYARENKDHGIWPQAAYYFEEFLATKQGWVEDNIAACLSLGICYRKLGDTEKVLPALLRSFEYDTPRAEICNEIGYMYKRSGDYAKALKWFQLIANQPPPETGGFVQPDEWGYIPNIESCVCACYMGDYKKARYFNERAAEYKPEAKQVVHNRQYLDSIQLEG